MGVAKIADADLNGKGNIGKADTPGVTLSEMQRIMDEIPREVLVPKINAIIDDVNLKSVRAETYTKTETDTAINNKMIAIGAGDMAKSVYDPDGDGIVDDAEKLGGYTVAQIMLLAHPVGSIYESTDSTSPATLFGGTWAQIKDKFLLSAGDTYAAGATGGEATHVLTVDEMPSHNHVYSLPGYDTGTAWYGQNGVAKGKMEITESSGGGLAHNNMPPYLTVYVWQRTA